MKKPEPIDGDWLDTADESAVGEGSALFVESEFAFLFSDEDRLNPFPKGVGTDFSDSLAQAVAAAPADLFQHVRRIYHCFEHQDGEGLAGALTDLFIVLGPSGRPLRRRLLEGARQGLSQVSYQVLAASLREGKAIHENDLPATPDSVLRLGTEGGFDLVHLAQTGSAAGRSPLTEAREFIEYSQLDQAREVLETALETHPDQPELLDELLSLYLATRDEQNFLLMRDRLEEQLGTLPLGWRGAQQLLCGGDES